VWIHTRMMLEGLPAGTAPTLAWGVLLHDVGKPPTFQSTAETGTAFDSTITSNRRAHG